MTDPDFPRLFERVNAELIEADRRLARSRFVANYVAILAIITATVPLILTGMAVYGLTDPTLDTLACHVRECV